MKLSDFIEELNLLMTRHGDLEVVTPSYINDEYDFEELHEIDTVIRVAKGDGQTVYLIENQNS